MKDDNPGPPLPKHLLPHEIDCTHILSYFPWMGWGMFKLSEHLGWRKGVH